MLFGEVFFSLDGHHTEYTHSVNSHQCLLLKRENITNEELLALEIGGRKNSRRFPLMLCVNISVCVCLSGYQVGTEKSVLAAVLRSVIKTHH